MDSLPLPTLLSYALVAFTIEFDNESEHQLPHSTTSHGSTPGAFPKPWIVSMVMWFNCLQFVGEDGITVGELEQLARTPTNLDGMRRWGYIYLSPPPGKKSAKPQSSWFIRATPAGRKAQEIGRPMISTIENRWYDRFGKAEISQLRRSLSTLASQLDPSLPDCLPILGYGLTAKLPRLKQKPVAPNNTAIEQFPLPSLLSKVLLAFTFDFEHEAQVSLAIGANVLRLIGDKGIRLLDLPQMSAVSKEAIAMATGFLKRHGFATEEAESPNSRTKLLKLTAKGVAAQHDYRERLAAIEQRWHKEFGPETIQNLRASLETLIGEANPETSPLFRGLEPYPEGWRASIPRPKGLPHFPMVLHRGGFPDGS
jgi:DNA-binding MarR family transcriptional regulator